jgi:hypothetical protein
VESESQYAKLQSTLTNSQLNYGFTLTSTPLFSPTSSYLASHYGPIGRCLAIIDSNVYALYREQIHGYFEHHNIPLSVYEAKIKETACKTGDGEKWGGKDIGSWLGICEQLGRWGVGRTVSAALC